MTQIPNRLIETLAKNDGIALSPATEERRPQRATVAESKTIFSRNRHPDRTSDQFPASRTREQRSHLNRTHVPRRNVSPPPHK